MIQLFVNRIVKRLYTVILWMWLCVLLSLFHDNLLAQCQYVQGDVISFSSTQQNNDISYTTVYVLADYQDSILDISAIPSFPSQMASVYKVYAINYLTITGIEGLSIGQPMDGIYGACYDISVPLIITVCPPINASCNTFDGLITFNSAVSGSGFDVEYALTDEAGMIIQLSLTPQFSNVGIGQYLAYGIQYSNINGLAIGQSIHNVTGNCYAISKPLWVKSCTPCIVDSGDDLIICQGESSTITAVTAQSGTLSWNTGQIGSQIIVGPNMSTTYIVTLTTIEGCIATDSTKVDVSECNNSNCYTLQNETITFNVSNVNNDPLYTTTYVLTDYKGVIIATSQTNTFVGQLAGVYKIYAVNYLTNAGVTALGVGTSIYEVYGSCYAISGALEIIICLPSTAQCNTTNQTITVTASSVNNGLTTQYILADASNTIIQISSTPSFSNIGYGYFLIYAINYNSIEGLGIGQNVSAITGQCYEISNPIWIKSCSTCNVTLSQDFSICNGQSVILTTTSTGQGSYIWNTGETTSSIAINPATTTTYSVIFSNTSGCISSDEITVTVENCNLCTLYDCEIDCNVCGSDIAFNASGENTNLTTQYVMTDSDGLILNISSSPQFSNVGNGLYFIFGVNYDETLPYSGLSVGGNFYNIEGQCLDISDPYIIKVCAPSLVGDYLWLDTGTIPDVQDSGDTGINGIVLQLFSSTNPQLLLQEVTTSNHPITNLPGFYQFEICKSGEYFIKVINDQYIFVASGQGGNENTDSDIANFELHTTELFTVSNTDTITNIDIGMTFGALPIELLLFEGKHSPERKLNHLVWMTASEINIDYFILEKSIDGETFESIAVLKSFGNNHPNIYHYDDTALSQSFIYYYRLIQVDNDGRQKRSDVVIIRLSHDDSGIALYPNPAMNSLKLTCRESEIEYLNIQIYDLTGRLTRNIDIDSKTKIESSFIIDINEWPVGTLVLVIQVNEKKYYKKIVRIE